MTNDMVLQRRDTRPLVVEARSDAGRVPPHDLDAEAAVLAAVLLESRVLDRVRPLLVPEQFYSDANRRIFEAAIELSANGTPVDIITVATWLRDRDWINQIGGPSYLVQLVDSTPSVANVEIHASIIIEKHRLRQFIGTCQAAAANGYIDIGGTVDEFIGQHEQAIRYLLRSAPNRQQSQALADIMQDVLADVNEACARNSKGLAPRGLIPTKFPKLDVRLAGSGFMRGNMYVFGARPGMGKTALATSLVTQICECVDIAHDPQLLHVEHKAFFWSGEMPRKQLVLRLWCADSGVPFTRAVNGTLTQQEWNDFTTFGAEFAKLPIDIEDKPGITVAELEARVRESRAAWERSADPSKGHRERRLSVVVVDYLTLMRGTGKEKGREETVAGISRDLKEMAKRLDVALIALVQLNRMVESRTVKDKRPQLSDIRESGQIEQDADLVAFIHRPEYYHPTNEDLRGIAELIFAKQRNGTPTCTVFFHFNGPRMRFGTPDPTLFARISEIYAQGNP